MSLSISFTALLAVFAVVDATPVKKVKASPELIQQVGKGHGSKDTGIYPKLHTLDLAAIGGVDMNGTVAPSQGTHPISLEERDLIGPDNRFQYTNPNAWPWRATGKVLTPGGWCSGALVGPSIVLTARHCADRAGSYQFCPSYDNGANPTFGCANAIDKYVPALTNSAACDIQEHFAILRLDRRYGDGLGYFGIDLPRSNRFNQGILTSVGYPQDRDGGQRPYRQDGINVPTRFPQLDCSVSGPIRSDADAFPGQSGSPLWIDAGTIWGVLGSWITNNGATVYINYASGKNMQDSVQFLRNAGA